MKKIYTTFLLLGSMVLPFTTFAAVHQVTVQPSSFSPALVNAEVGDTIVWTWAGGNHSTTSTTIPAGATSWDHTFSAGAPAFAYQVTVAGTYDYVCNVHFFAGQIVVTDPSGIQNPDLPLNFNLYSVSKSTFNLSYSLRKASDVRLTIYDVTGKSVKVLTDMQESAGEYDKTYYLDELQSGIYMFEMLSGNQRVVKRIIID